MSGDAHAGQRPTARKIALAAAVTIVLADALLLASGRRVLLQERRVNPGESYVVPGWGDLGSNQHASLVCRYFTGRSVATQVYWYAPSNLMGKDECPFVVRADD